MTKPPPSDPAQSDPAPSDPAPREPARLIDYLRLVRAPNVFTVVADVTMGFLVMHQSLRPLPVYLCLLLASCLMYFAGMVLNDVFDIKQDRAERPQRPLPSGRISLSFARGLGFGMLSVGLLLGVAAGLLPSEGPLLAEGQLPTDGPVLAWRSGAIAVVLALCIIGYDAWLKRTPLGPIVMGACRFFNILLGMSVGAGVDTGWPLAGYGWHELIVAGGLGLYVVGITWFARHEAGESRPIQLIPAAVVMMAGIGLLGLLFRYLPAHILPMLRGESSWWLLLGLLAFTILRRLSMAIANPSPRQVQWAIKHSILSLIMLDAAIALEVSHWSYALGIVALLAPSFALGFWVYST